MWNAGLDEKQAEIKIAGRNINNLRYEDDTTLMAESKLKSLLIKVQFSSVAQSCPTLCNPMDCSTSGFPVHQQLLELTQIHVHWVGDTILMAESEEESQKVGLKLNIQKTKIMASGPITSWHVDGETMETETLFFWAPESLQMVTAAVKLKDAYSLEGKLWPTLTAY